MQWTTKVWRTADILINMYQSVESSLIVITIFVGYNNEHL